MGLDLNALAGLALAADLVPRPVSRRQGTLRLYLHAALGMLTEHGDLPDSKGALVITRLDNGATVRLTRSDREDGTLLAYVRGQLAELTVAEFLDRWGVDPAALDDGPGGEAQ